MIIQFINYLSKKHSWFSRFAAVVCLACAGCSPNAVDAGKGTDIEEGGAVENADRERAEAYFVLLGKVQSAQEEEALLTEFGEWLTQNDYKISVVEKNGKHELACPYFPPITPWAEYKFVDIKNLELLPRLESSGQ